jgi:hypothetical protein
LIGFAQEGLVGDPEDPGPQEMAVADRFRAADENQERCLASILDVVLIAEDAAADAQDHRPMSGN